MTVYDIPNIEHCDVIPVGTIAYRINCHEGWYVYLPTHPAHEDENGNPTKVYKTATIIRTDFDFSTVEITAEADLPSNAEICGDTGNEEHEIM